MRNGLFDSELRIVISKTILPIGGLPKAMVSYEGYTISRTAESGPLTVERILGDIEQCLKSAGVPTEADVNRRQA